MTYRTALIYFTIWWVLMGWMGWAWYDCSRKIGDLLSINLHPVCVKHLERIDE